MTYKYILSGGADTTFSEFWHGYLYSEFFFVLSFFIYGLFYEGMDYFMVHGFSGDELLWPFFQFLHMMTSLFGVLLIVFAGLTAKSLRGWRAGCIAIVLMVLSPRIFGHSMNNPKDIPFAASYMMSTFFMMQFLKEMPKPQLKSFLWLTLSFGILMGVRVGGFIQICHFFFFGGLLFLYKKLKLKEDVPTVKWFMYLIIPAAYGYLFCLFFWPYGQLNPFTKLLEAIGALSKFEFGSGNIVFAGKEWAAKAIPWYYVPHFVVITSPLMVLAGWVLFGIYAKSKKGETLPWILLLLLTSLLPILFVILRGSVLYNGWRHFYFIYGPLVVLAALGWDCFFEGARLRIVRHLSLAALAAIPLVWMVQNHPYQSVYFNAIGGGIKSGLKNYETDYWGNSVKEAALWLGDYHLKHFPDRAAVVRADGHVISSYVHLRAKLGSRYMPHGFPDRHLDVPYQRFVTVRYPKMLQGIDDWDYAITLPHKWELSEIQKGNWPPPNTLYEVKVDDTTICAVVMNPKSVLLVDLISKHKDSDKINLSPLL